MEMEDVRRRIVDSCPMFCTFGWKLICELQIRRDQVDLVTYIDRLKSVSNRLTSKCRITEAGESGLSSCFCLPTLWHDSVRGPRIRRLGEQWRKDNVVREAV